MYFYHFLHRYKHNIQSEPTDASGTYYSLFDESQMTLDINTFIEKGFGRTGYINQYKRIECQGEVV